MDGRTARKLLGVGFCLLALATAAWWGRGIGLSAPEQKLDFRTMMRRAGKPGLSRTRPAALWSPVVIHQIGLADPRGPVKSDGSAADWIELYNRSSAPVPLRGFTLTDAANRPAKWRLPDVVLPPREFLLIWADGLAGVSSPWGVKNPVAGVGDGWDVKLEPAAPAGYVFHAAAADERTARRLAYRLRVPESGLYDLWVAHRPEGPGPCLLEVQVDGRAVDCPAEKRARHFLATRVRGPDSAEGSWQLKAGRHHVDVILRAGATSVDRLVLTRRELPFGGGTQDIHAGLKLKKTGETIGLHSPHGVPLDYVTFPPLEAGRAYRRIPAGDGAFQAAAPEPGGKALLGPPAFSLPDGVVSSGAVITVTAADPRDVLRYTTDGTMPTEASPQVEDALEIRETQAVTVRAFREQTHPGAAVTRFYYVGTPPDIPLLWCTLRPADFTGTQSGIRSNPHARGPAGERRAHACLILPDGTAQAADVGIRPQGRSTRSAHVKKSFRLSCRARYGSAEWPGRVFEGDGSSRHTSFVLMGRSLVKHALGLDILRAAGTISPRFRHVLFQINETPMGVYLMLEDPQDPAFLQQAFGHLDLDVIKEKTTKPLKRGGVEVFGKTWLSLLRDPERTPTLSEFAHLMDPVAFMRWAATVHFLGLTDNRQGYFVRDHHREEGPWAFMSWDLDDSFEYRMGAKGRLPPIQGSRGEVFTALMKDAGAPRIYVESAQVLLNHPLKPDAWIRLADRYVDIVRRHMDFEYQGHRAQETRTAKYMDVVRMAEVFEQARRDVTSFLRSQPAMFWRALQRMAPDRPLHRVTVRGEGAGRLRIDGWPDETPYEGFYFEGTPLCIEQDSTSPAFLVFRANGREQKAVSYKAAVTAPLEMVVRAAE
ncbi:MAG: CotH kinase family protein [Verrucomicrobia bacterium]|nr:CotH kinase family protein [Verrucomicrobiota bacterium]